MNILEEIIAHKRAEVSQRKEDIPLALLEHSKLYDRPVLSLKEFLQKKDKTGIIAEFKRRSPSKGMFNAQAVPEVVTTAYREAGASGLSILTDAKYFGGSGKDLIQARKVNDIPILRKDFIIDEFQIMEARAIGADVILLIAACLEEEEIVRLARFAKQLQLEVLLEIHNEAELDKICPDVDMIGINNRDLASFRVDVKISFSLAEKMPAETVKISESGITDPKIILELKQAGFKGFLIGEAFMKEPDPGEAFAVFVDQLNALEG